MNHPLCIAGPCSAESLEQLRATASQLREITFDYYRAGVWKPRTRPGTFEGHGEKALPWLNEIQHEFGYKVAIEVASTHHVELALKAGIDAFWIGARSVTNPFTVQEIAESLKGVDIPVFIKNPVNPDLKLWIGAVERIENATSATIHAIHRGFSVYEKLRYRNDPNWQIALDFKIERPDLKLICDPSHMGGSREYLFELSQIAMDLHFDGLHLEVHHEPSLAWTDADQQVNGKQLQQLLSAIRFKDRNDNTTEQILELRQEIDDLDEKVLSVLIERMKIVQKIGTIKSVQNSTIYQAKRWIDLKKRNIETAKKLGLSEDLVVQLLKLIHQEAIRIQASFVQQGDSNEISSGKFS